MTATPREEPDIVVVGAGIIGLAVARELLEYGRGRALPARQDGKLIVALSSDEIPRLDELERRGRANGVPGLRRLEPAQIAGVEPHVTGVDALHSPATAVVD